MKLRLPSARRKKALGLLSGGDLNLVPILDTLVTLIGFLMFNLTVTPLVFQEASFPQAQAFSEASSEFPLQLCIEWEKGPATQFKLYSPFHTRPDLPTQVDSLEELGKALRAWKKSFPKETQISLFPHEGLSYESLLAAVDTVQPLFPHLLFGRGEP